MGARDNMDLGNSREGAINKRHGNSLRHAISFSSIKASARRLTNSLSPGKQGGLFRPLDIESPPRISLGSSTSPATSPYNLKNAQTVGDSTASLLVYPDTRVLIGNPNRYQEVVSTSSVVQSPLRAQRKVDGLKPGPAGPLEDRSPLSPAMIVAPFANNLRSENGKPSLPSQGNSAFGQATNVSPLPITGFSAGHVPTTTGGAQIPISVYQHIQQVSAKRISSLDYLRKAHERRVYWFNTLLFNKVDLEKLPYLEAKKVARRAANYLLLGLSIPTVLDINATSALEYLRALNALLVEFESYQQVHPPDGSSTSSLSRARIPQMFKRAAHVTGSKGRRTSSAADIGLPLNTSDPSDLKAMAGGGPITGSSATSSFPVNEQELLPGEEYTHLITPSLPFDPDFFETFSTLCDVLIDCYTHIMSLVPSPLLCVPGVGENFAKADSRIRKIILGVIIKDFEEGSRNGAKTEMANISKVVLGGLI